MTHYRLFRFDQLVNFGLSATRVFRICRINASWQQMKDVVRLPIAFEFRMRRMLGPDFDSFYENISLPSPTSIRLNPHKSFPEKQWQPVTWCPLGRYLTDRPLFTLDPHFHAGAYYVQEASSMFLEQALKQAIEFKGTLRMLDLCAAPGGKSTHLLSLMNRDSLLVSNEVIRSRASVLSENIQKWGHANAVVTNNDPADFQSLPGFFDLIVVDAPCSGEGLFRKDPEALKEWSEDKVNLCSLRQRRILNDVWPALKDNGILIYCTCTYNELENEQNLDWLAKQKGITFIELNETSPGVKKVMSGKALGYRFFPHLVDGEGFFISILRKQEGARLPSVKKSKGTLSGKRNSGLEEWFNRSFYFINHHDLLIAVPEQFVPDIAMISDHLHVVTKGVAVATSRRTKFVPEHSFALSIDINKGNFPLVDLSLEQALQYLRKENISITDNEKGFALVQFEGNPIGWINRLENRVNNLYPSNWRILLR